MKLSTAATFLLAVSSPLLVTGRVKSNPSGNDDKKEKKEKKQGVAPWSKDNYSCPDANQEVSASECGQTYTEGVVTLGRDLFCNGNLDEIDNSRNAAITLIGPNTVLDCNGFTLSQVTNSTAAAVDCTTSPFQLEGILKIKQDCGLFYFVGIVLTDGATMRNCHAQKFYFGVATDRITGPGEGSNSVVIEDSDFTLNRNGAVISHNAPGATSKIIRSNFHGNGDTGLDVGQFVDHGKVIVEDVTAKNNGNPIGTFTTPGGGEANIGIGLGMRIAGTGLTIRNTEVSGNSGFNGIKINPNPDLPIVGVNLEGEISIHNNQGNGLGIIPRGQPSLVNGTVSISADLNIYLNGANGFFAAPFQGVDIILEKGGSLSSCNNARLVTSLPLVDILNNGTGSFLSSGKGKYTCDTKSGEGEDPLIDSETGEVFINSGEVPDCKACPACL